MRYIMRRVEQAGGSVFYEIWDERGDQVATGIINRREADLLKTAPELKEVTEAAITFLERRSRRGKAELLQRLRDAVLKAT